MRIRLGQAVLGLGGIVAFSLNCFAYSFTPTETEWVSWPSECKAIYAWTPIGAISKYSHRVTDADKAELGRWERDGIIALHHFCTGTIWLNRSRMAEDSGLQQFQLREAYAETRFTYDRSLRASPRFPHIAIQLAIILHEQQESDTALQILAEVTNEHAENDILYSVTAYIQRKLGRLEDARDTLLRGNEAVDGGSAEILYNLGLVSLELGAVEQASEYAEQAYAMGYPLPGLKRKLQRHGY